MTISNLAASVTTLVSANKSNDPMDDLFRANVEALTNGEISVSTCLGFWGECTLPDGTRSKAPAIHLSH